MSNNQMVLAPRELLERLDLGKNTAVAMTALPELRELLAKPAEQHQGEPVAWALIGAIGGTEIGLDRSELLHDQGKYGGDLAPLYTRPAQGEPACYTTQRDLDCIATGNTATIFPNDVLTKVPLYTHADPAEVGRLRAQLAEAYALLREYPGQTIGIYERTWRAKVREVLAASADKVGKNEQ